MKKHIWVKACLCAAAITASAVLGGCLPGASVSLYQIEEANKLTNVLSDYGGFGALTEKLTYYGEDGSERFSYSVYIENADDGASVYNVCETVGDYKMSAHEGEVYISKDGKLSKVLLLDTLYYEYISDYLSFTHILDSGERYQSGSEKDGDRLCVSYYAKITKQLEADLAEFGLKAGDKLVSEYVMTNDEKLLDSVTYSVNGRKIAVREFTRSEKSPSVWNGLPEGEGDINVTVFTPGKAKELRFLVPENCFIGVYSRNDSYRYYTDEECTELYSFGDSEVTDGMILYAAVTD